MPKAQVTEFLWEFCSGWSKRAPFSVNPTPWHTRRVIASINLSHTHA
jgi:hypothetical protein